MPNGGTPQACLHCQWSRVRRKKRFFGLFWKIDEFCTRHQVRLPLALYTFCADFTIDDKPAPIIQEEKITGENMYIWMETAYKPSAQAQVPMYHHEYVILAPLSVYATWTDKEIGKASRALYDRSDKHSPL
jgi:hypothetical protein